MTKTGILTKATRRNAAIPAMAAALMLVVTANCRTQGKDVSGWNTIVWGTTVEAAQKALGPKVHVLREEPGTPKREPLSRWEEKLEVKSLKIAGIDCEVVVSVPRGTDSVKSVLISPGRTTAATAQMRAADFELLADALIMQYGPATTRYRLDALGVERMIWRFPSTVIELSHYEDQSFTHAGAVSLSFRSADMLQSD